MSARRGGPEPAAPTSRRRLARTLTLMGICLALLAAAVVVSVRALRPEPTVTLLANWEGADKQNFEEAVIEPFERRYHIHVDYQGSSAESEVLGADVAAGTPPDIVVLTGPGELAAYQGEKVLKPLDGLVAPNEFSESWATQVDGHLYWFPLKADLKSIVWYPGDMSAQQRRHDASQPGKWCLGMGSGATSGWPGTDWVEDIVLQQNGPEFYERWARGEARIWQSAPMKRAWKTWGRMVDAGGANVLSILKTGYKQASDPITRTPPGCTLEHQGSYIRDEKRWQHVDGRYEPSSRFIPHATARHAWEVSGDLVALLNATPQARKLIRYLASADAQRAWNAKESGFSVAAGAQRAEASAWHRSLSAILLDKQAVHCFDASDAMPPTVRDAFAEAVIDFLAHPEHLDGLLKNLDSLRRAKGLTWLQSVCDRMPASG
ncbi:ABC transporter substrate-binding protein [Streptomyces sp. NK08204]|uniref:ABC transporter substrate-binding protein n=1 Tax=Streptomyces sp. NK08204 TaxID=2873260 RepID=UPI001CEDE2FC|nr:ABC transporter substrate-binding protein [Streptomyces sp. NK08204]